MMKQFWLGFRAVIPLWAGMIPFALAYAVTARSAGLSILDTQLMSMFVFAGSAQFSGASMFLTGAAPITIILTTFIINVRHLLYSLSLGQKMKLTWAQRFVGAHFLTDEAFGITLASGQMSFAYLLGAELSIFVPWNLSTLAGSLLSEAIPDGMSPERLGIDFIFPLAFLALLIPLLKVRVDFAIAITAGAFAFILANMLHVNGGVTILLVGVLGSLLGAFVTRSNP
ncbi:MAG: AzlC family ABC transporter permease [Trueperaceae bacterium]